jgi:hypothetical protein
MHVPRSAGIHESFAPSKVEVAFRLIIEAARADALGRGAVKYQRIDGTRPWAMDEVGGAEPDELGESAGPRAGLLALLHAAPTATRA